MNIERRVKNLERKLGAEDELRLVIYRQLLGSLDEKAILQKHSAEAKAYIDAHPELWDKTPSNGRIKFLTTVADRNGWNIKGHTRV